MHVPCWVKISSLLVKINAIWLYFCQYMNHYNLCAVFHSIICSVIYKCVNLPLKRLSYGNRGFKPVYYWPDINTWFNGLAVCECNICKAGLPVRCNTRTVKVITWFSYISVLTVWFYEARGIMLQQLAYFFGASHLKFIPWISVQWNYSLQSTEFC
jgi:hypothetical protein